MNDSNPPTLHMVISGDDNGQNRIIQDQLTEADANQLHQRMLRGHKQWYSVIPYTTETKQAVIDQYRLSV